MPKDRYYFPHDHNARNDRKIAALVRDFKSSGYGIFWATCEMMHEESGELEFDDLTIEALCEDLNENEAHLKQVLDACINKYKLFLISDNRLNSHRVRKNLTTKEEKRDIKAKSGSKGGVNSGISRRKARDLKINEAPLQANRSSEPNKGKKEIKERNKGNKKESKNFNSKPQAKDFNGLPETYIEKSIELIRHTKHTDISTDTLNGLWEIFKVQNLTGYEYYANEGKVYSHFLNWVKTQRIDQPHKPKNGIHI